ncbi:transposase [Thermoanaerobacter italicus]|uniref:transposase n=1 Tax=Thermoanaerobacter italicus TaxID=108150 RepID=UPI0001B0E47A|nr:transposase [Thermoanaerobacter italicus]
MNVTETCGSDAYRILTRFLSEQAYCDEKTRKLKAKESKSIPSDSLQSAYDEGATYRKKGNKAESDAGVKNGQTVAHFPKKACTVCELKNQCYCKEQKKDYVVRINLKSIEAAKQRKKIEFTYEENKSKRAAIEGTNSALKRGHGLSKLRVRGLIKCKVNVGLKVLVQNFKRFARYMLEQAKKATPKIPGGSVLILAQ